MWTAFRQQSTLLNYLRCLISGGCATFVYPEESSYGQLPGPVFCVPPDHTPTIWSAADYEAQQRFDRVWTRPQSLAYNISNTSDPNVKESHGDHTAKVTIRLLDNARAQALREIRFGVERLVIDMTSRLMAAIADMAKVASDSVVNCVSMMRWYLVEGMVIALDHTPGHLVMAVDYVCDQITHLTTFVRGLLMATQQFIPEWLISLAESGWNTMRSLLEELDGMFSCYNCVTKSQKN